MMPLASAVSAAFAQALGGIGIGVLMIQYLYGVYQAAYVKFLLFEWRS
jgi:hypothetical protein